MDEDIGTAGRSFIALHGAGHECEDATIAIDPASFAHHGAIRLVAAHSAALQVQSTIEGIDPPAQGCRPLAWLALTVELVSDRRLFSLEIPPPKAVPDELA